LGENHPWKQKHEKKQAKELDLMQTREARFCSSFRGFSVSEVVTPKENLRGMKCLRSYFPSKNREGGCTPNSDVVLNRVCGQARELVPNPTPLLPNNSCQIILCDRVD
jgi:hypothetical protein